MLAEASGCGAVLDVAAVPGPPAATVGDWLTCFPGFAMLTADGAGRAAASAGPATSAVCGELTCRAGRRPALAGRRDDTRGALPRSPDWEAA